MHHSVMMLYGGMASSSINDQKQNLGNALN